MRRTPFYASGLKPVLVKGANGALAFVLVLITGFLVYTWFPRWPAIIPIAFYGSTMAGLRAMAKADPILLKVKWRAMRFHSYYPPHGTFRSSCARTQIH
jgi:type IV secretory pathway TrbD component